LKIWQGKASYLLEQMPPSSCQTVSECIISVSITNYSLWASAGSISGQIIPVTCDQIALKQFSLCSCLGRLHIQSQIIAIRRQNRFPE
jgi:hypothetical protein